MLLGTSNQNGRRFFVIENKSFDLIWESGRSEGLRIFENGRGYRTYIFLNLEEVNWLLMVLEEFYWRNIKLPWAKRLARRNYNLQLSFGSNRRGPYLALSVVWGRDGVGGFS